MAITYDPAKRDWTLRERGLDFEDADEVFASRISERPDDRRDYGEIRIVTIGFLRGRMIVLVWTRRGKGTQPALARGRQPASQCTEPRR